MIEVDVLSKPFNGGVSVSAVDQSQVNGVDVLHSALLAHKSVSLVECLVVAQSNS
jgi:hypothetical protein